MRLCSSCIEEYTSHKSNLQPVSETIANIFGENYQDCSFDNFYVQESLFRKYNKLLREENFSEKTVAQDTFTKEDLSIIKEAKKQMKSVTKMAFESGGRLVLRGHPGTGKTHLLCSAARVFVRGGMQVSGISALKFAGRITDTYSQQRASEEATKERIIDNLTQADAVFIDDLSGLTMTNSLRRNITWLFKETLRYCDVLMIATTISQKRLASDEQGIGPEAYDALREPPSWWIDLNLPSFRRIRSRLKNYYI